LRLPLNQQEMASMTAGVLLDTTRIEQLEAWVDRHYRDELTPDALADPQLLQETRQALDALTELLGLGALYAFQREGASPCHPF
jgi:succinylarginine dihydrolase